MVEWNGRIANTAKMRPKGHNVWWITLGFKLMLILSSMVMSALILSGQLATITVGSTHIFVL